MVSQPDVTADARFAEGLDLYARGKFFECHEVLEDLWRDCGPRDRYFVQALIHLAVAFYQSSRLNRQGSLLQLGKCMRKLAGYLPAYAGIDTRRLLDEVDAGRRALLMGDDLNAIHIY